MSMEYIRNYYGVPAKRGQKVKVLCGKAGWRSGVIVASKGAYLRIKINLPKFPIWTYHPESENLRYVT